MYADSYKSIQSDIGMSFMNKSFEQVNVFVPLYKNRKLIFACANVKNKYLISAYTVVVYFIDSLTGMWGLQCNSGPKRLNKKVLMGGGSTRLFAITFEGESGRLKTTIFTAAVSNGVLLLPHRHLHQFHYQKKVV